MLCIDNPFTDPYFNLATEEYLLKNFSEDCFMLWRNEKSIIVGKHQNTLAEINMDFIRENNIKVVRRISGGGTVFHDLGNLNFTFIMNGREGHLVDFKKYTTPIIEVLRKLNIDAGFQGKNNIVVNGRKISGNAEHVYKKRVMHHGTLLFSSVLNDLNGALRVDPRIYESKAVKSIRSQVTNILNHLETNMDIIQFRDMIMEHIMETFPGAVPYNLTDKDIQSINLLKSEKYLKWEWNFGYSPKYEFRRAIVTANRTLKVILVVSDGIIEDAWLDSEKWEDKNKKAIESLLKGIKHTENAILEKLGTINFNEYINDITPLEFARALF